MNEINQIYVSLNIYLQTKTLFRLPGFSIHFLYHPDTFRIIRSLFRSFWCFSDHTDTYWIIWTLFRSPGSSRNFSYHPDIFRIIRSLFRSHGYFSEHIDTLQVIWTLFYHPDTFQILGSSRHFLDRPVTFHTMWILFRSHGYLQVIWTLCRSPVDFLYHMKIWILSW